MIDPELAALMGEPPRKVNQAMRVIAKLGGHAAVARAIQISREQVYRWTYPVERGGTGGLVPSDKLTKLLAHARTIGVMLTPYDLDPRETSV